MNIKRKQLIPTNPRNETLKAYERAVRVGMKQKHVIRRNDGKWELKRLTAQKPYRIFDSQKEATSFVRSGKVRGTVFVHGTDGLIRDRIEV
jgi:hypothetical protein